MRALSIAVLIVLGSVGIARAMTPTATVQQRVDQAVQSIIRSTT